MTRPSDQENSASDASEELRRIYDSDRSEVNTYTPETSDSDKSLMEVDENFQYIS